ncbi:MAG: hypothetical protein ACI8TP_002576 [Acidimicrobiales bacterium]
MILKLVLPVQLVVEADMGLKEWERCFIAALMLAATLAVTSTGTAAQDGDGETCVTHDLNSQFIVGGASQSPDVAIAIPAGTVSIPNAVARDFYPGRDQVSQASERWELQFLDGDGKVIATSAATTDVPDLLEEASWSGSLGTVELPADAVSFRAVHRPDLPDDGKPNSVWANGVTLCWTPDSTPIEPDPTDPADPVDPAEPCLNAARVEIASNDDGTCSPPCGVDNDGIDIVPNADGTCPGTGPSPDGPVVPGEPCTNAADEEVAKNADGTCPTTPVDPNNPPAPLGPVNCGTDVDGNVIDRDADGNCPTPTEPPPPPLQPSPTPTPTPTPTLPITGTSTWLLSLGGLFMTAAGLSLVLRPRSPLAQ